MDTLVLKNRRDRDAIAAACLKTSVQFWFFVTVIGQWLFVYYIAGFYAGPTLQGNFEAWSRNKALPHGFVAGDTIGNLQFAGHVLLAAVMTLAGTLQLIPQLRARVPALHRWSGRLFIVTAIALSIGGLYMVWISDRRNHLFGGFAISLNALSIIFCAVMAWRYAIARDFASHRRWALRTFVLASGVWFMRLGYMAWIIINQGPVGIAKGMTGPFDYIWALACFLLPLTIVEIYLHVQRHGGNAARFALTGGMLVAAIVTAIGSFGAYMFMWRNLI